MSACRIKAILTNTRGREFEVQGYFWSDGTIRVDNPRPKRYQVFKFLYTNPETYCKLDPKRLYWLTDDDAALGDLSPFRVKAMLLVPKPRKGRVRG